MEITIIALLVILCVLAIVDLALRLRKNGGVPTELRRLFSDLSDGLRRLDDKAAADARGRDARLGDEFARSRGEIAKSARENRDELRENLRSFEESLSRNQKSLGENLSRNLQVFDDSFSRNVSAFNNRQREQFDDMTRRQEDIRASVDRQLAAIREETARRLDEMRKTVDENLKDTVEKRFNDSFGVISERLEKVHQGLGDMRQLAAGVGDLKKALTNVKTRGTLGEIQLGAILEQILSPGQYEAQASVGGNGGEKVDFVIKLPDKNSADKTLLLPIDSKFPVEDYQRLVDAYEGGRADEAGKASAAFESAVRRCARDIQSKYLNPPVTTDFAIMFVPTEGLYAEIVRRAELFAFLQRENKVTVVGPTNLSAFLNSLQMGFRTLAIEARSGEVWELLGAVKTEFGKFGGVVDSIKKKLDQAVRETENFGRRSKAIERRLRAVGELPAERSAELLGAAEEAEDLDALSESSDGNV
ncbi:MAG: DNA recombination protein RmuC [Firmicutes bacterium]|nr:DNA recombination protein RmuC [Bacillota bacterium]